jgi:FixJ family two-component response regulator
MPHATPIVFVVDDDISVRESLESLIRCAGWHPEIFASAQEFLSHPRANSLADLVNMAAKLGLTAAPAEGHIAADI